MVVEVVRVAGRTEVFGDVIRDVDASVWHLKVEACRGSRRRRLRGEEGRVFG